MTAALLLGICLFLSGILVISLANQVWLRRLGQDPQPTDPPRVSVLIPARNEAGHIEGCVRSLLAQDYPRFEVQVLDDGSDDETPAILARLVAAHPGLGVTQGEPLPPGWTGKNWACAQLARRAQGDLLLFTDADTRHQPGTLRAAVAAIEAQQADLLAVWPGLQARSLGEKLVVPLLHWSVFSILSLPLAHRLRFPALSAAIGQFLLFRRPAYEHLGGHAGVRGQVAEDLALARRIKAAGRRWRLVDGQQFVRTRMYAGFGEAWRGLAKNLYPAFGYRSLLLLAAWIWLALVAWLPLGILAWVGLGGGGTPSLLVLAGAAVGLLAASWAISLRGSGQPLALAALYPVLLTVGLGISLQSLITSRAGSARWKGRRLVSAGEAVVPPPSARQVR